MIELLSHSLQQLVAGTSRNVLRVLAYPINPGERLFVLYLATSLLMAAAVWRYVSRRERQSGGTPVTLKSSCFGEHLAYGVGLARRPLSFFIRYSECSSTAASH